MNNVPLFSYLNTRVALCHEIERRLAGCGHGSGWHKVMVELSRMGFTGATVDEVNRISSCYIANGIYQAQEFLSTVKGWIISVEQFAQALNSAGFQNLASNVRNDDFVPSAAPISSISLVSTVPSAAMLNAPLPTSTTMTKRADITSQLKEGVAVVIKLNNRGKIHKGEGQLLEVMFCDDLEDANDQAGAMLDDDIDAVDGKEARAPHAYVVAKFVDSHSPQNRKRDRRTRLVRNKKSEEADE